MNNELSKRKLSFDKSQVFQIKGKYALRAACCKGTGRIEIFVG